MKLPKLQKRTVLSVWIEPTTLDPESNTLTTGSRPLPTCKQTDKQTDKQTHGQTNGQTNKQSDKQTDNNQTNNQREKQTQMLYSGVGLID